jgi:hypothetical protein
LMNHSIKILNYQSCFFIRIRKYQKEVRIQLEAILSEDQFLGLYGIIECGVQAYEVRNGPILEIVALRDFSIPKSQKLLHSLGAVCSWELFYRFLLGEEHVYIHNDHLDIYRSIRFRLDNAAFQILTKI